MHFHRSSCDPTSPAARWKRETAARHVVMVAPGNSFCRRYAALIRPPVLLHLIPPLWGGICKSSTFVFFPFQVSSLDDNSTYKNSRKFTETHQGHIQVERADQKQRWTAALPPPPFLCSIPEEALAWEHINRAAQDFISGQR